MSRAPGLLVARQLVLRRVCGEPTGVGWAERPLLGNAAVSSLVPATGVGFLIRPWLLAALLTILQTSARAQLTEVSLANGQLTLRAAGVPVVEVLDHLSKVGAMEITGQNLLSGSVSATIENEPVQVALVTILRGFDYVLSTRPGALPAGTVYTVRILRRQHGASSESLPSDKGLVIPALEAARFDGRGQRTPDAAPDDLAGDDADRLAEESDLRDKEATGAFEVDVPVDALRLDVDDVNPLIRVRVLQTLVSRGMREALPHLVRALGDDDSRVADYAVEQLGGLEDSTSLRQVGDAAETVSDATARLRALRVFALRADRASVPYARALLKDESASVRQAAVQLIVALTEKGH